MKISAKNTLLGTTEGFFAFVFEMSAGQRPPVMSLSRYTPQGNERGKKSSDAWLVNPGSIGYAEWLQWASALNAVN